MQRSQRTIRYRPRNDQRRKRLLHPPLTDGTAWGATVTHDYNHHRRHSSLGRVSPVDYERSLEGTDAA
jgi:hypothetical protein